MMQASLNGDDPHYRYDLRTSQTHLPLAELDGYVMAQARQLDDGRYLTILVMPKHRYSLRDDPISGSFTMNIADPAARADFQDAYTAFECFGRGLDLPEGTVSARLDAPSDLGGTFECGSGWIGPAVTTINGPPLRLAAVSSSGQVLAELPLRVKRQTTGQAGGSEIYLADDSDTLTAVLQLHPPNDDGTGRANLSYESADISGRPVMRVLPLVRLFACLSGSTTLELRPQYGNQVLLRWPVDKPGSNVPDRWLSHLEDLAILQERAIQPILVPEAIEQPFAADLSEYARMLKGEVITGTWNEVTLTLDPGALRAELPCALSDPGMFAMEQSISVDVAGQRIDLGRFTTILRSGRLADEQPEDNLLALLVPEGDVSCTRHAGSACPEEAPRPPGS